MKNGFLLTPNLPVTLTRKPDFQNLAENISFAQKHIFFAQNVITRVRVYTFRPGKKFLGSTKKGLSFDTKLARNPNPETGLPELG